MNEPLILGFTLGNTHNEIDVKEIYDELEQKLPCTVIDRSDWEKPDSGFRARSVECLVIINPVINIDITNQLYLTLPIIYGIYEFKIKPLLIKNPNIKFYVSFHTQSLDVSAHVELGEYRNKDEFTEALVSDVKII